MVSFFFFQFSSILSGPVCSLFLHLSGARVHIHTALVLLFASNRNRITDKSRQNPSQPMRHNDMLHEGTTKKYNKKNEKQSKYASVSVYANVCVCVSVKHEVHCVAANSKHKYTEQINFSRNALISTTRHIAQAGECSVYIFERARARAEHSWVNWKKKYS